MSQSIITDAFSVWLAECLAQDKPARPDKMVFAWIDGRDENTPIDPEEVMPGAAEIRHVADITQFGTLNESAFVCSVVLDTSIGDWDYNWIGLVDSESDALLMVVHPGAQRKLRTIGQNQGNTLTRNLAMQFSGAAAASQITVTAETWQIDFSARLHSMDEARRLALVDYYGPAAFRDDGFLVTVADGMTQVQSGLGYVSGLRVELDESRVLAGDGNVWVDAVWSGTVTGNWTHTFTLRLADSLEDYVDAAGFQHYVTRIATVAGGVVTDERIPFPQQRLEQIISDSRDELVPVTRKVNNKQLNADITLDAGDVGAVPVTRKVNNKQLNADITLGAGDVGAVPVTRKVNNKQLNADITLGAGDVGAVPVTRKVNNKQLNADITLGAGDVGAYTKEESDARYVRDVRLGAQVLVEPSGNGSYASITAPVGHVLTAILDSDTPRWPQPDTPDRGYARPVQKFINNQWITVSQL